MNVKDMIEVSSQFGTKESGKLRNYDYVLKKLMEEVGELSTEIQIEQGCSYKDAGKDGISGESVDVMLCAMDMFYLDNSHLSTDEISEKLEKIISTKQAKWLQKKSEILSKN